MTLLLTVTIICSSTHVLLLHLLLAICCPILYSPRIFLLYWVEFVTLTHFGICSHSSGFLCQIFFSIVGVWDMSSQGSTCIFSFRLVHTLSLINVCSTELITLPRKITGTLSTKYAFKAKKKHRYGLLLGLVFWKVEIFICFSFWMDRNMCYVL